MDEIIDTRQFKLYRSKLDDEEERNKSFLFSRVQRSLNMVNSKRVASIHQIMRFVDVKHIGTKILSLTFFP